MIRSVYYERKKLMSYLLLVAYLVLTFGISWLNAWGVGRYWTEVHVVQRWWPRIMVYSGVTMAAVGMTWVYLALLGILAGALKWIDTEDLQVLFDLGYLTVIGPLIVSGFIIWVDSLMKAVRNRTFGNIAVAGWNTYAQVHNVWSAAANAPDALGRVRTRFHVPSKRRSSSSNGDFKVDPKAAGGLAIILLFILAVSGGIITTVLIVRNADKNTALDVVADSELSI